MLRILLLAALAIPFTCSSAALSQDELPPTEAPQPGAARGQRTPAAPGAAPAEDAEFKQQVSYALGRNFAENLRNDLSNNEIDIDVNALVQGFSDTLSGAKPKWADEQLQAAMERFSREMQQKMMTRMTQLATKNKREAEQFLAQNAKREGVQTTPSGLQFRVIKEGDGPSPTLNDTVRVNYRGTLLNGTEFDNSAQRGGPAEFTIAPGLIAGWIEGLQKMKVGDKWQLFVPPQLAYGEEGSRDIEPNSLLVFDIELLEILPQ